MKGLGLLESRPEELFYRVGEGIIKLDNLNQDLKKGISRDKKESNKAVKIDVTGSRYVIATCCNPIPGDSVIGFVEPDGNISIHKKTCSIANSLASKYGDRIVMPTWENIAGSTMAFPVRIQLKGFDRIGMINDITKYISFVMNVNIRKINIGSEDGIFDGYLDLLVPDRKTLEIIVDKLTKIEGIQTVLRSDLN